MVPNLKTFFICAVLLIHRNGNAQLIFGSFYKRLDYKRLDKDQIIIIIHLPHIISVIAVGISLLVSLSILIFRVFALIYCNTLTQMKFNHHISIQSKFIIRNCINDVGHFDLNINNDHDSDRLIVMLQKSRKFPSMLGNRII